MFWLLALPTGVLAAVAVYALVCVVSPDVICRRCQGARERRHFPSLTMSECRSCRGRGSRIRWGVRWWARTRSGGADRPDWTW